MVQHRFENLAFPAQICFLLPTCLGLPLTNGTVDKPAEMTHFKFPRWANPPQFQITAADLPARSVVPATVHFHGKQKKYLPFYLGRNVAPSLLITLNRFEGNSK
jgi:hypothetical protein